MNRQQSFSGTPGRQLKTLPRPTDETENMKKMRRTAPPVSPLSPEKFDMSVRRTPKTAILSKSQIDPFYRHGEDEDEIIRSDETVTIFGFPRPHVMTVIDDFSVFGKIKNFQLDPNGGNWAHVQFENKFQAARAKEQHGKVFSGFMIGVTPCLDGVTNKRALDDSVESCELTLSDTSSRFSGMRNASVLTPHKDRTQVFDKPTGPDVSTPTKSSGLLSYLFSW